MVRVGVVIVASPTGGKPEMRLYFMKMVQSINCLE
jgi:hypothetical protein